MPGYNFYPPTYGYQSPYNTVPQYPLAAAPQVPPVTQIQPQGFNQTPAPVPAQAVTPTSPSTIIWVNGEKEAALFPVNPNSAVALWDSANPVIFLKQADASGKPTMKTFDLVERVESTQDASNAAGIDMSAFAAKADLAAIAGIVSNLSKDMESMKDELANLAGQVVKRAVGAKPKPAIKEPVQDEEE